MQRDGQRDGQTLLRQALQARDQPAGGDGDAARRDTQQVGVGDGAHGAHNGFVVSQRLAHAHEHDVREPAALAQQPAVGVKGLVDDLVGGQVAAEGALAGGAEGAADRAADLRRDA